MTNKNNLFSDNKLLIALIAILLILSAILAVLIYKTCKSKNIVKPREDSIPDNTPDNTQPCKTKSRKTKHDHPSTEKSNVMDYALNNIQLENHLDNKTIRYDALSKQSGNASAPNESELGKFRNSIFLQFNNRNNRMLMTEEVKTVISFLNPHYEQIEIGAVDVARRIEELEVIESNDKTKKQNINERITARNQEWESQCKKINEENNAEKQRIDELNKSESDKIAKANASLIQNYKKNNPHLFQQNQSVAQAQQPAQSKQQKRLPKTGWEKFLNLFGLFNPKEESNNKNVPMQVIQTQSNFDLTKIPGYQTFIQQEPNLKSLPEKPSDEESPAILGNQLQGQYILHKKIYECIQESKESNFVVRVPGHYYHVRVERKSKNNTNDKEVNIVIADSAGNGQAITNHIQDIKNNGIKFVDYSKGYFNRDENNNVIGDMQYPEVILFNNQIKIYITQDQNKATQSGGYECGLFSIYNGNKEFFNDIGLNFAKKASYPDFNEKLHGVVYLLFRASLIYGYFESNVLWNLKARNQNFNENQFYVEILNEAKELCKTFLKSIGDSKARNGGELSVDRYNKELIRFDETFFNKVREKAIEKVTEFENTLDQNASQDKRDFVANSKNVLKNAAANNQIYDATPVQPNVVAVDVEQHTQSTMTPVG
jgi:hypothetical protein